MWRLTAERPHRPAAAHYAHHQELFRCGGPPAATGYVADSPLKFRRCGSRDRVLVGRPSQPPQLYWVSNDAAVLLELLGQRSLDEVIHTFAQRWRVQQLDATDRLTALLSDLYAAGLLTTKR